MVNASPDVVLETNERAYARTFRRVPSGGVGASAIAFRSIAWLKAKLRAVCFTKTRVRVRDRGWPAGGTVRRS